MAELHIQRKRSVWAWVVALIVVLLLIGVALMWMDGSRAGSAVAPEAYPTAVASVATKGTAGDSTPYADATPACT